MISFAAFKLIHVFGVVLFLGNIIVTAMWKSLADRTRDPRIVAFAQRLVTQTDRVFTAGGVVLILIGGFGMLGSAGLDPFGQSWLIWGQGLLLASGVIWVAVLLPIQIAQAREARGFAAGGPIPELYWRLNRRWTVWGVVATMIPLAALYFMIFKP